MHDTMVLHQHACVPMFEAMLNSFLALDGLAGIPLDSIFVGRPLPSSAISDLSREALYPGYSAVPARLDAHLRRL